jgi:hypothetical protein
MTITVTLAQRYEDCYQWALAYTFSFCYEYPEPNRRGNFWVSQEMRRAPKLYAGQSFTVEAFLDLYGPLVELKCNEVRMQATPGGSVHTETKFALDRFEGQGAVTIRAPEEAAIPFHVGQVISLPDFFKRMGEDPR